MKVRYVPIAGDFLAVFLRAAPALPYPSNTGAINARPMSRVAMPSKTAARNKWAILELVNTALRMARTEHFRCHPSHCFRKANFFHWISLRVSYFGSGFADEVILLEM